MATSPTPDSTYQYTHLAAPTDSRHEFRLLKLYPGKEGSEIECDQEVASHEERLPYEALSYTWGNPKGPECTIPCQGDLEADYYIKVHGKDFRVGYNLMSALQHIRLETSVRTLWIDAICINQMDDVEKSYQVQAMDQVYRHARLVLAWLGEADEYTNPAFDWMSDTAWAIKIKFWQYCSRVLNKPITELTRGDFDEACRLSTSTQNNMCNSHDFSSFYFECLDQLTVHFDVMWTSLLVFSTTTNIPAGSALEILDSSNILAPQLLTADNDTALLMNPPREALLALVNTFSNRAYWSRLWVVQEVLSASDVHFICGRRHINIDCFYALYFHGMTLKSENITRLVSMKAFGDCLHGLRSPMALAYGRILTIEGLAHPRKQRPLGEWLMERDFGNECVDMRDKVYALMAISAPIDIRIDYTLPVEEVYALATKKIINQQKSLDFILQHGRRELQTHTLIHSGMPSWVPRFDTHANISSNIYDTQDFYSCCGSVETVYEETSDLFFLNVDGYFCSEIKTIVTTIDSGREWQTIWEAVLKLPRSSNLRLYPNKRKSWRDRFSLHLRQGNFSEYPVLWKTLARDVYLDNAFVAQPLKGNTDLESQFASDIQEALNSPPPARLMEHLRTCLRGETVCLTSDRKMALTCGLPQKGDQIFMALGGSLPLIIRPLEVSRKGLFRKKQKTKEYALIGSAFIYDYMDGEMFKKLENSNRPRDHITLV